jgi:PAS domain S-box-containing protein
MKTVAAIHSEDNSCLISTQGIVTDIGNRILELTGYLKDDILNKDISEVFIKLLKLHKGTFEQVNIKDSIEGYIFTKSLEVREVAISLLQVQEENKTYHIVEKPNSRLDDKLIFEEQLFKDNIVGCSIYSVPDLILLKSNQKYLDFMNPPYNKMEKCIGTTLEESVPDFAGSNSDELFAAIIKTGKPNYYNEYKYDHYKRGITYWDGCVVPIYTDGKVKYIFQIASEISQRVANRNHVEEQAKIIKKQNEQLQHQNALLNRQAELLNLSHEAIFAWDLNGAIIYWNKGAEKKYGYSSSEAIGRISHDLLKTVHFGISGDIKSILARDGVWVGEIEHTCKDGKKLILDTSQQVILNEIGQAIVLETNRDITERKNMEKVLKNQKKQLEVIIKNITSGIFVNFKDGTVLQLNEAARKLIHKPDELKTLGDSYKFTKYFEIDGQKLLLERTPSYRALHGETVQNERFKAIQPDKELILEISSSPVYDDEGTVLMSITSVFDVTELVSKTNEIRNQKENLDVILENMTDAIAIFDKSGKYIIKNKAFMKLYPETDVSKLGDGYISAKFFDACGKEIPIDEMPIANVKNGQSISEKIVTMVRGDETYHFSISGTPLFDKNGNVRLGIICTRNISRRIENETIIKQQQQALLKAEMDANAALKKVIEMKDEFFSIISHEFKTPLTVINSAIQAMELICRNELSVKAKGFLNKIRQNSNRQLKLVNNLLDITRMNAGHLKVNKKDLDIVSLTKSITESIAIFAEQKGIRLSFCSTLSKRIIGIDEEKYERILLNLLSNAVKFTPKGKTISVRVSQKIVDRKCKVCIQVRDKGIGIPQDKMILIFERFGQVDSSLTRQAEGTGIGLHLVKMLVEIMCGEITLESKEGMGSTFTILLPVEKTKETPIEQMIKEINDNRLIQATAIEFSDIYL